MIQIKYKVVCCLLLIFLSIKMYSTPVLLIIFNRPKQTSKLLDSLIEIKPKVVYVSADGPRENNSSDKQLCEETRALIKSKVTWDCEVKLNFSDKNQGCGKAVSSAISWFFEHNELGVILEDDCLPDVSFYLFCEDMLYRYKDNKNIMHIGGANFQNGKKRGNASYYFSSEVHVWGWASWRRAWNKYDFNTTSINEFITKNKILNYYQDKKIVNYWLTIFKQINRHEIDTWDYQWKYSIWNEGGLAIIPQINLISNIGFGLDATHTSVSGPFDNMKRYSLDFPLIHPSDIKRDKVADSYTFNQHYKPKGKRTLIFKVYSKFKKMLR